MNATLRFTFGEEYGDVEGCRQAHIDAAIKLHMPVRVSADGSVEIETDGVGAYRLGAEVGAIEMATRAARKSAARAIRLREVEADGTAVAPTAVPARTPEP